MMVPCIHRNGTSRESLLEQLCDARIAVEDAMTALAKAAPNGRDYYPLGNDALRQAEAEHRSRADRLRSVRDELQALALLVYEAGR
jgi:hypothetical protein